VIPGPFRSGDALDDAFAAGLGRQLANGGIGSFILVLANAGFGQPLWQRLHERLAARYQEQAARLQRGLRAGELLEESADDQLVFLKVMAIGLDHLHLTEFRRPQGWELQYNLLRGLRPPRLAGEPARAVREPFDPHSFNFTQPFLAKELLWQGRVGGRAVSFFYNKFPFVRHHLLMVPEPAACRPQFLTRDSLSFAWRLLADLGQALPGIGMGYNSYGALASVNHLHFQCFDRVEPLPLERSQWRHNGGRTPYPAACRTAESETAAWRLIRELHAAPAAYNLLMRPGRLYVLARRFQGTYAPSERSTGHAWYEMAGGTVVTRRGVFDSLGPDHIAAELARVGDLSASPVAGTS
jgi:hypothetical protein